MFRELDVVRLKRTIPEIPVPAGTEGTIVHEFPAHPQGYLVELPNGPDADELDTDVYFVDAADMELVWREGHWYVPDPKPPGNI